MNFFVLSLNITWSIIKILLYLLSPWIFSMLVWLFYWRIIKKIKPIKGEYQNIGYGNFFKRLFIDFPKQFVYDRLTADPDFFREFGVHIVSGEQGSGKTVTVAYLLRRFKKMYPKLKVKTNFNYKYQDSSITHWKDIVASENGIYGEIDVIDELQNWFSSLQSKDFPIEMLTEITQQRKQRKCIIGTSQVFTRVAKPIREQTYLLYEPFTLFGCLTIVRKYKPIMKSDSGQLDDKKLRGIFFFVHDKELRDSFDTYHKIKQMALEGFKPSDQLLTSSNPIIYTNNSKKK